MHDEIVNAPVFGKDSYRPFKTQPKKQTMRAKFYVTKVVKHSSSTTTKTVVTKSGQPSYVDEKVEETVSSETLHMSPVCPAKFGPAGEHEDNDFHRWSPSGSFELTINNPELFNKFVPGQKYYMDFSLADA